MTGATTVFLCGFLVAIWLLTSGCTVVMGDEYSCPRELLERAAKAAEAVDDTTR